jgi:hypothetical protein
MFAVLFALLLGCGSPTSPADFSDESYGLLIVVDGARGDLWKKYAAQGRLPNVQRLFVDGGVWVDHGTTTFPTITGAAMPTVLTGTLPSQHGIPSLYFFDRATRQYPVLYVGIEALQWNDWLSPNVKTIWEHFPGEDDALAFGPALNRGADTVVPILWSVNYKPIEYRTKLQLALRALERKVTGKPPARLSVVYNGWFDHMCHVNGAESEVMDAHYTAIDEGIGEAVAVFNATLDAWEKTIGAKVRRYVVLTSDHGHQDIRKVHSIDDFVRLGKRAKVVDKLWTEIFGQKITGDIPKDLSDREIVLAAGEGHALLYFPTPILDEAGQVSSLDWDRRPTLEMLRNYPYMGQRIDILGIGVAETGAVAFMLAKDWEKGVVHVYGESGEATIERQGDRPTRANYRYTVVSGEDPLALADHPRVAPLVDGQFHPADDWQIATVRTEYPDAMVQLFQAFDTDQRAPDVYVSARPYVSIGDLVDGEKSASKHGGLTKEESWVVVAFHGTGIKTGTLETARNADVVPTLLTLLEQPFPAASLDGRDLSKDLVEDWGW